MRMSADLQDLFLYETFLYYNPLLLVTMMVRLWGVNLWVFAQSTVNYAKIFDLDHNHLTHQEIWKKLLCFSALKYSTAIPVILLSALKYHVFPENWTNFYHPLWLMSSVINPLYSFYWDLARDWDLSVFARIFNFKIPHICTNIFYGWKCVCYWVISSNLILRCTWTYKLSAHLRHNYLTVFTITALEIFRHFQWIFFRVEDEWNKMTTLRPSLELAMDDNPKEDNRLLGSSNHGVNKPMLPIPAPAIPFSFHWILMALQHFV